VHRRARTFSLAALSVVAIAAMGAGLAWACTPSGFGTPATPSDRPAPNDQLPEVTPPATAPSTQAPAPSPAAPRAGTESASGSVSGATGSPRSGATPRVQPAPQAPRSTGAPATRIAPSQFAARESGATAGVTRSGGQVVFSGSGAPAKADARGARTKKAAKAATGPGRAGVSDRTATADLWSGVAAPTASPISAAEATADGQTGGIGGGVAVGLAILGLGVAGLAGALILIPARRRAASKVNTR